MVRKIVKNGNSQAIVLPREITEAAGLQVGSYVDIKLQDGHIGLYPVDVVPRLSEADQKFVDELYAKREKVFKKLAE